VLGVFTFSCITDLSKSLLLLYSTQIECGQDGAICLVYWPVHDLPEDQTHCVLLSMESDV
jgi:hypothetical protein